MLDLSRINEIVGGIVRARVPGSGLERVFSTPMIDSEGDEALRITLVLTPELAETLSGDEALDVLIGIQQTLDAEGEQRFPIIAYATEEDLAAADDGLDD